MKNRVYGIVGVQVKNSNFNADFNGMPRQNTIGDFFSSDKALKYACRTYWDNSDEKVLSYKSYKEKDGEISPITLEERYNDLFTPINRDKKNKTTDVELLKNLFAAIDVVNYGIAFAVKDYNFSIHGVAQLDMGLNKRLDATCYEVEELSPFQNSNKTDSAMTTLGSKTVIDEAHYFYNLTVNPTNLKNFEQFGISYKEEDYLKLKEGLMKGVSCLKSQSKSGCENEFGLFIKLKEDSKKIVPDLANCLSFEFVKDDLNVIDLKTISSISETLKDHIEEIEVIYNPYTTILKNTPENAKILSIFEI